MYNNNNNNNVSPLPVYHFVTGLIVNSDVLLPVEIHHGRGVLCMAAS